MFNIVKKKEPSPKIDQDVTKEAPSVMDKVLLCIKSIIEQGNIVEDNASSRNIPSVKFEDSKGNTLYISWFSIQEHVMEVELNGAVVPEVYDKEIFQMAKQRIQVLRKEHLERVIDGMKG